MPVKRLRDQWSRAFCLSLCLAGAALLGGCASTIEALSDTQDSRILNADSVQGSRGDKTFTKTVAAAFGDNVNHPEDDAANALRGGKKTPGGGTQTTDRLTSTFNFEQSSSDGDAASDPKAREYIAAGLALSNEVCDAWFSDIGRAHTTLRQSSDIVSGLGNLSISMLDLSRAVRPSATFAATFFGIGKSAIDSLDANYVVAADIPTVKDAVKRYRGKYAAEIEASSGPWTYFTARRVVMAYDNTCSAMSVQQFIKVRIQGGSASAAAESLLQTLANTVSAQLKPMITGTPDLTQDQLVSLYICYVMSNPPADTKADVCQDLHTAFPTSFPTAGSISFVGANSLDNVKLAIQKAQLDAYLTDAANQKIAEAKAQKQALADVSSDAITDFLAYARPAAPAAGDKMYGWDDMFSVHATEQEAVAMYIFLSPKSISAGSGSGDKIRAAVKPFVDASGKPAFKAGVTTKTFLDAISSSPALAARMQSAADTLLTQWQGGAVVTAHASTNSWAIPQTSDGRSLDVPPPIPAGNQ